MRKRPQIVIIGGGFGGINAARALRRVEADVIVVDRRNHHLFQPLLYQVATAALDPSEIASPIRSILRRQRNAKVILAEVERISIDARQVHLADGEVLDYDYLVVAAGAVDQYFGHADWPQIAPGLKSVEDAITIRRRFLLAFEAAEREDDPDRRRSLLTTVVIGGGPTGVELAGAMAEMARRSFIRDFRRVDPTCSRIILVEGTDRVLPAYDADLSAKAEQALRDRGVEVRTGSLVTRIEPDAVYIGDERIETRNVIWSAGVAASPLSRWLDAETDRMGRVIVEPDLSVPGHPEVFVIGDLAHCLDDDGNPLPGLAPVAIQQGRAVGRNLAARIEGRPTRPFHYVDKGTMATIGRSAAVAKIGPLKLWGFIAWLAWIFVHIFFLIGFRNRFAVMFDWAWQYFTWQRGARIITDAWDDRLSPLRVRDDGERDESEDDERLAATASAAAAIPGDRGPQRGSHPTRSEG